MFERFIVGVNENTGDAFVMDMHRSFDERVDKSFARADFGDETLNKAIMHARDLNREHRKGRV